MESPIGIFDSGVGGTSIWKEINGLLPWESTLYLADSRNAPYGEKGQEEILRLCIKNTEYLLSQNCKIIVVACNTATTNAIAYLRDHYEVPFIGIEPAIKPAALKTKTGSVGVLATKGTLASSLFHHTAKQHASGIRLIEQEGAGLVSLIEAGELESGDLKNLVRHYVKPMLGENIDCLVLGCTHYPYLIPLLKKELPSHITIIDSGAAVAKQTKYVLERNQMLAAQNKTFPNCTFYTNTNTAVLKQLLGAGKHTVVYKDF